MYDQEALINILFKKGLSPRKKSRRRKEANK